MADTETAGTPGTTQEGADAAAAASGTPALPTDGGDARADAESERIRKLEEIREKYLANLETVERANEVLRREREQTARATTPPTGYDPAAQRVNRAAQLLQSIGERDPEVAQAITEIVGISHEETQTAIQRQQAEQKFYRELADIPAADKAEVERRARAQGIWPSAALRDLKAERFDSSQQEIIETRRKLQEQEERLKRNVVRTDASPATSAASANPNTLTRSEFAQHARQAALGNTQSRQLMDDYDAGRIKLRDG